VEVAVPDNEPDAERELATYLTTFVAALPTPYREALVLTELQEMNHKDAAQMLGVSLPAMKARVRRGRQQIQQMLTDCCDIALDSRGRVISYDRRPDGPVPRNCCADGKECK
jgi:RNA polymerase sigma-70 factor (ECF subfamily)